MRHNPHRPLSPEAAAVLSAAGVSRRGLLRGALAAGAFAAGGGLLAGCGTKGTKQSASSCTSEDLSATEKTLNFSNWPLYIDVDEKDESKRPTLDEFTRTTGIKVSYNEDVNDNNEFFGKVRTQLGSCQPTGRDLMVLTDWLAARLIRLGWVQKLDKAKLPNVEANLLPSLKNRGWDAAIEFAVPWQSGLAALAYNGAVTKEIKSVDDLLTRPDLKGKVTLLAEMRDTMGLMLQSLGHDPAKFTDAQYDEALAKLEKAVKGGQIRRFTGNDYAQDLKKGDVAACMAWSGDVIQLTFENEKIKFVTPDSGTMLFSDNMQVPNKATHKANAETLMNYYYDPKVAAEVAAYVNYICPVQGAREELAKSDKELAENPLIFPDSDLLGRAKVFMALSDAQEKAYEQKFQSVTGA